MKLSLRNKLIAISFSTSVFTALALIFVIFLGAMLERALILVPAIGFIISLFEEFYVQGRPGRWFRAMHPAKSIIAYSVLIVAFTMTVMLTIRMLLGPPHEAGAMSEQLDTMPSLLSVLPVLFASSIIAIMTLRIVGYLGARNLFHLLIGKYYRPVLE